MRTGRSTAARGLLAAGAAAGLAMALGAGSAASAKEGSTAAAAAANPKTISMRSTPTLRFTGSTHVKAGEPLRIRNLSDPKEKGPHTFTLVAKNVLPDSPEDRRACFTPGKICLTAAVAHKFDEEEEKVNRPHVDALLRGWDRRFSRKVETGDSWYSETKDEEITQDVRARPGQVLRYMCIIHPEMQGQIRVTD